MYRLLEQNIEELDKEELKGLINELDQGKQDNPLIEKLMRILKDYEEGKVRKHSLQETNHVVRTVLTLLKKNKQEELATIQNLEKEEIVREKVLDESIQCPNCNHLVEKKHRYCPSCGREIYNMMDKVCPRCNSLNEHPAHYCKFCGKQFDKHDGPFDKEIECPFCGKIAKGGIGEKSVRIDCTHCGAEWGGAKEQYEILLEHL